MNRKIPTQILPTTTEADAKSGKKADGDGVAMERIGRYGGWANMGDVSADRNSMFPCL